MGLGLGLMIRLGEKGVAWQGDLGGGLGRGLFAGGDAEGSRRVAGCRDGSRCRARGLSGGTCWREVAGACTGEGGGGGRCRYILDFAGRCG